MLERRNYNPFGFAPPAVRYVMRPDGGAELESSISLPDTVHHLLAERLAYWARMTPDRILLSEREGAAWRTLSYAEVHHLSGAVGEILLKRDLGGNTPILIFGQGSRAQFLLRLGALRAGIPFVPASPALLRFDDGRRLRRLVSKIKPSLIALSPACAALLPADLRIAPLSQLVLDGSFIAYAAAAAEGSLLVAAESAVTQDTLAAIFLTSGSTDEPKGVEVTHRMIAANQTAYGKVWRFLEQRPPVILDWLPWHHTFGGNDNLHKALWFGGTYYIDDGQPSPERFARSVANICDVRPTIHLNVPRGLALLVERLEADETLFDRFFVNLDLIFFAAAGLEADLWGRLRALVSRAEQERGREIALVSGYGSTESGSTTCLVHFPIDNPRIVGLPIPGLSLRLVPEADKLEARIKGPMVTPGYWRDTERTAQSFDEDGYFRSGDALRFVDPDDPSWGLMFDGRIGEDFKLSSGTWVSVGPLRLALLSAFAPLVTDVLIAGHDLDRLGLILFLEREVMDSQEIRSAIATALARHNAENPASSTSIARALIDPKLPSAAEDELSDKGTVNQRVALRNRALLIDTLYRDPASAAVIVPKPECLAP